MSTLIALSFLAGFALMTLIWLLLLFHIERRENKAFREKMIRRWIELVKHHETQDISFREIRGILADRILEDYELCTGLTTRRELRQAAWEFTRMWNCAIAFKTLEANNQKT